MKRTTALLLSIPLMLAGCATPVREFTPTAAVASSPDPQCVEAIRLARQAFSANVDILDALRSVLDVLPDALEGAARLDPDPIRRLNERLKSANATLRAANEELEPEAFNAAADACTG